MGEPALAIRERLPLHRRVRIFISIPAYRDPDLVPTVRDLVAKAAQPGALTFAIFEQTDAPVPPEAWPDGVRVWHDYCPAAESEGPCWARARIQERYAGEEFYLQLDAHHRFVVAWDDFLRAELDRCPARDPILSTYLPWFFQKPDGRETFLPLDGPRLEFSHFDSDGVLAVKAPVMEKAGDAAPTAGVFLSAHFLFARGDFVTRVPYDPVLYYAGEEIALAARAFTHGCEIFHTARTPGWHLCAPANFARHWDADAKWPALQARSLAKLRRLFAPDPLISEKDGLGTARTLAEYEARCGLDLRAALHSPA